MVIFLTPDWTWSPIVQWDTLCYWTNSRWAGILPTVDVMSLPTRTGGGFLRNLPRPLVHRILKFSWTPFLSISDSRSLSWTHPNRSLRPRPMALIRVIQVRVSQSNLPQSNLFPRHRCWTAMAALWSRRRLKIGIWKVLPRNRFRSGKEMPNLGLQRKVHVCHRTLLSWEVISRSILHGNYYTGSNDDTLEYPSYPEYPCYPEYPSYPVEPSYFYDFTNSCSGEPSYSYDSAYLSTLSEMDTIPMPSSLQWFALFLKFTDGKHLQAGIRLRSFGALVLSWSSFCLLNRLVARVIFVKFLESWRYRVLI